MSVSIIVPCYNVAPYVEACLDSLVNQSLRNIEIICVNDGSTDVTPALLDAWAEKEDRIRVIHRENGGQALARNLGMDMAGGEYVGFVDPDDYVEPSMFARLVEEARRHGADVTACGYTSFSDGDGSVLEELSWSPAPGVDKGVQSDVMRTNSVWERMDVVTCNKLYRRDFLDRHGLRFETSFRSMEDDVLWLMVLAHATCLAVIPDRLYWYRRQRHGSVSQMLEAQERPLLLVAERLLHATEYWKKCGWLESGLERGWVLRALRHYLLVRLLNPGQPLPQLSEEEWGRLRGKCREWFALAGKRKRSGLSANGTLSYAGCWLLRRNIPASCPVRGGSFSPAAADGGDVTTGLKGSFPLAAVGNSFPADWFLTFCASLGLAGTPVLK